MNRRIGCLNIVLTALITLQATLPLPLLAVTTTDTRSIVQTVPGSVDTLQSFYKNPSYDEINQKLENIAREKQIPSILLKVIAYRESAWRQFDSLGKPLLGGPDTHPALGIMQVATYSDSDSVTITKLKTDIDYNIRRGAELLDEKFRFTPRIGDGDRNKLENWYFALWAYYSWSSKNNPNIKDSTPTISPTGTATTVTTGTTPKTTWVPYQDSILALCAKPEAFLARYIQAVAITKIPASLISVEGLPSKLQKWETPLPIHYGDLDQTTADLAPPTSPTTPTNPVPPQTTQTSQTSQTTPSNPLTQTAQNPQTPRPVPIASEVAAKPSVPQQATEFVRLAGNDRVDTAVQQALKGWPSGASAVVLARADNFPDALAGIPLASKLGAPVLLTSRDSLDSRVEKALKQLAPDKVYLLGGEGALSKSVATRLSSLGWSDEKQIRLSGQNRYETAAQIALETAGNKAAIEEIILVTGENFPDALSIASIAGFKQIPILLSEPKSLPTETLQALKQMKPKKVYIVGGEGAIANSIQQELQARLNLTAGTLIRLSGSSRYDTMAAVADAFITDQYGLCFATGEDFPDALTGAALAAHLKAAVILLPKTSLEYYPKLKSAISQCTANPGLQPYIFGGTGAVSSEREKELKQLLSRSEIKS